MLIQGSPSSTTFDFSSDSVINNRNQIYCNSKSLSGNGYDLLLEDSSGVLEFRRQPMGQLAALDERLHDREHQRYRRRHRHEWRSQHGHTRRRHHGSVRDRACALSAFG